MSFKCTCRQCHKEFEAVRSTAKFCSASCRVAFSRGKIDKQTKQVERFTKKLDEEPKNEKPASEIERSIPNQKMAKAILALIENRRKILSRGYSEYATFFLGETLIQLGLKEVIVGDTKFKLPKPKKK